MDKEYKYKHEAVNVGDWNVSLVSDEDGHLGVYISHKDGSEIIECQAGIGDEHEWAERFTTEKIENNFNQGE